MKNATDESDEDRDARADCYRQISSSMANDMANYYREFPDRRNDERSIAAGAACYQGLKNLFNVLQGFRISRRVVVKKK